MGKTQRYVWSQVFDSLEDMILVVDEHHKIIEANKKCEEYLDIKVEDIKGSACDDLFDIDEIEHEGCPLMSENSFGEKEIYHPKKDSYLLVRSYPISDDDLGWIIHQIQDLAEKEDISEQLNKYKNETKEMIQSEKMASLGRLVSGVAHEVNNPLGYMRSSIGFIMEDIQELKKVCEGEKNSELLDEIDENLDMHLEGIDKITNLTETLRDFVSPDIDNEVKTDVNENIKSTLTLLTNEFREDIKLKKELGELPDVKCNPGKLNQVFMNVIYNALQSMDKGTIEIKTWVDGGNIFIKIKDNGRGIPEDVMNKIFDPFYTTKDKSTGLGLSVTYSIVKEHGGDIQIESEEGVGTEVTISIPMEVKDAEK